MENRVLLTLTVLLLAAGGLLPLVNFAPNRLVSGRGIGLAELLGGARLLLLLPALGLLALGFMAPTRPRYVVVLLLAEGLLCGLLWLAGEGARELAAQGGRLVRTSFGSGFWLMAALCLLTAAEAVGRLTANPCLRALANGQLWLPLALLLASGRLDELSLKSMLIVRRCFIRRLLSTLRCYSVRWGRRCLLVSRSVCCAIVRPDGARRSSPRSTLSRRCPPSRCSVF